MEKPVIQLVLSLFLIFAISRVYLRYRARSIGGFGFIFWSGIFTTGLLVIIFPNLAVAIAHKAGIARGVDFIIYVSIALLFYLVYRLYVYLDDVRNDIAKIIRELAMRFPRKPR